MTKLLLVETNAAVASTESFRDAEEEEEEEAELDRCTREVIDLVGSSSGDGGDVKGSLLHPSCSGKPIFSGEISVLGSE